MELPGTGDSPANVVSKTVGDLAGTIAKAADAITTERYTLIGTSFGAHVALWQAIQAPNQVEALILVSSTAIQAERITLGEV